MTNEIMRRDQAAAGEVVRQGIGGSEIERRGDTAATAVAAQAKAAVEARFALAKLSPRDFDAVRVRVLKEC